MRNLMSILLVLLSTMVVAQSIKVNIDRDSVVIGDVITLSYTFNDLDEKGIDNIDFSAMNEVDNFLYMMDSLSYEKKSKFEILADNELGLQNQNLNLDPSSIEPGKIYQVKTAIYDIGTYIVPVPIVTSAGANINLPKSTQKIVSVMPPLGMEVLDSLDIQPIKDIIREPVKWTDYLVYLYVLFGAFLLVIGFWYLMKMINKNEETTEIEVEEEVIKEPADVIAIRALKKLEGASLWQNNQEKEYHSRLTMIIKQYLEDRYDSNAVESTTSQIIGDLKKYEMQEPLLGNVENILNISDIVKFAKGEAGPQINQEFLEKAYDFVDKTRKIES